jgi:SAM-dependent methyltransferase
MSDPQLERWNQRFTDAEDYLFGRAPNAFLAAQRDKLPAHGRALAIADGEGRNGVWLARQGLSVTSVDFSPVGLAKARKLAAEAGVEIETVRADLYHWDWPEAAFDVVAAIFFQFAAPAERAGLFAGIRKTLRPGGLLILQGYRPEQVDYGTGGPPHRENMYTEALLREAFGDWEILHLRSHDSEVDEGAGHAGMSALIDLVARKPAEGPEAA